MLLKGINLAKMYGGNQIFENINIEINIGEKVGLVGPNGCGKTSLLKLFSGIEAPDSGEIHKKKSLSIGYLAQIPVYKESVTVKDALYAAFQKEREMERRMQEIEVILGTATLSDTESLQLLKEYGELQEQFTLANGYEMDSKVNKVATGLDVQPLLSQSYASLSGGEQTKVALGKLLLEEPEFLLLDEPTNHLDIMAVEWLEGFLQEYNGTFLVVSHDRYFLDEVVGKIINLEDGECHVYHGNYSAYVKEKEERLLNEFQKYEEQQKKIKKMKESIKRLREWANQANPPNEGLHKRARSMERALERMEKLKRPVLERNKMGLSFEAAGRSGEDVLQLQEVGKQFGEEKLFSKVNLHLRWRERAAVVGGNGAGKTTLLKLILGEEQPSEGEIKLGSQLKIGYLSQKDDSLAGNSGKMTVVEAFRDEVAVAEGEARHLLAKFMFYGSTVFRRVANLSGGERMRLQLAILMYKEVNLLILDEPTNHLDIESREVLEEALEGYDGTILAVSHDRYFLNKLFEKTYWIWNGSVDFYPGSYQWAKEKHEERDLQVEIERDSIISKGKVNPVPKSGVAKTTADLENEIDEVEKEILLINEEMMTNAKDWAVLRNLQKELDKLEGIRDGLYEAWEQVSGS